MILGIDATNISAGGGVTHLTEILNNTDPRVHGIEKVLVWSGNKTLDQLDNKDYIVKKEVKWLNKSLPYRVIWQLFCFDRELMNECDLLLSLGGLYSGKFRPYISMLRNMLIFDSKERDRYGFSYTNLRFRILRYLQKKSFRNAGGVIFVSEYARDYVTKMLDFTIPSQKKIYHGVSRKFQLEPRPQKNISAYSFDNPFILLYMSSIDEYKHQWILADAVADLREAGYPVELRMIGWKMKRPYRRFLDVKNKRDKEGRFLKYLGPLPYKDVMEHYKSADGFVFSSTCESISQTIIEAMSAGLPIACSNYQPMPEILGNAGIYFDPLSVPDTTKALKLLLDDTDLRALLSYTAWYRSKEFSWQKCSIETFEYISEVYNNIK